MTAFGESVFDDGQHRVVAFGKQHIAGADEYLHLIGLGARLVESLGQIIEIERDEIHNAFPGDAQTLPLFNDVSPAGISRNDVTL
jgi:hypothetical protein